MGLFGCGWMECTARCPWLPAPRGTRRPRLAAILDDAEPDVLAYMTFPKEHRAKLHSTNPIERLNGEIKRRTDVVGFGGKSWVLP